MIRNNDARSMMSDDLNQGGTNDEQLTAPSMDREHLGSRKSLDRDTVAVLTRCSGTNLAKNETQNQTQEFVFKTPLLMLAT